LLCLRNARAFPLLPAALASVPFGFVLVRVRVHEKRNNYVVLFPRFLVHFGAPGKQSLKSPCFVSSYFPCFNFFPTSIVSWKRNTRKIRVCFLCFHFPVFRLRPYHCSFNIRGAPVSLPCFLVVHIFGLHLSATSCLLPATAQ